MKIADLQIIVTGAASGMGRHFARRLAEEGARVLATDVNAEGLDSLQAESAGGTLEPFVADVTSEDGVAAMVNRAAERFGSVNGLINNAGLLRDALLVRKDKETGEVRTMSLADWQRVLDVDLTGPFLCARAVAERMIRTGTKPGVIVNISSISRHGNTGQGNYAAAKAGLAADTVVWARELARHGIRVGAIAPGFIRTPILDNMPPAILEKFRAAIPLQRVGTPEEVYLGVKFILECDYFTGRCLDIDGGLVV